MWFQQEFKNFDVIKWTYWIDTRSKTLCLVGVFEVLIQEKIRNRIDIEYQLDSLKLIMHNKVQTYGEMLSIIICKAIREIAHV